LRGSPRRGRFPEEVNVDVEACAGGSCARLFSVKAFRGRPPYYRPWVEVHSVLSAEYAIVEDAIVALAWESLEPGGRLFHEYAWDPVTVGELEAGVPPAASRLGFRLVSLGAHWLKDWYYPEGFMEGAQRLQAEKPLSPEHEAEGLEAIAGELRGFLARPRGPPQALARARAALAIVVARLAALRASKI